MNQTAKRNRQRTLRHATPERVRELLHAYHHRDDPTTTPPARPTPRARALAPGV